MTSHEQPDPADPSEQAGRAGRPRLHLTARAGWVNDPYGVTWRDGAYHLFFQHLPGRTAWAPDQHWGHAVSADLLHWQERPVALAPAGDEDGVWSGCLVGADDPRGAALLYTAVRAPDHQVGVVRRARAADDTWDRWERGGDDEDGAGWVLEAPPGVPLRAFRDPFVVRDGDRWRLVVGAGLLDGTALALTWSSTDLDDWRYDGELARRHTGVVDPVWTGSVWECPQLFRVEDRWVLVVSVWEDDVTRHEAWAVGDLVDGRFTAERWGRLSYGPAHYAASAFTDADGAPCLLHWLREVEDPAAGWAGAHSLPHRVRLVAGAVVLEPHPAVAAARVGSGRAVRDGPVGTPGTTLDVELVLDAPASVAELDLGDGSLLRLAGGEVALVTAAGTWRMPVPDGRLRVLLDGPALEVLGTAGVLGGAVGEAVGAGPVSLAGEATATWWALV